MYGLRSSEWTYDTGATGSVGAGMLFASGGTILLKDPSGQEQQFYYGGCGIGFGRSWNLKNFDMGLPKLLRLPREPGATGSTKDFTSTGSVYMTRAFHGKEMKRSDIAGGTVYIDAGAGIVADGFSGSIMLLGLNSALLMMSITMPQMPFFRLAINEAPAMLWMGGFNVGMQPGALQDGALRMGGGLGWSVMVGYLH